MKIRFYHFKTVDKTEKTPGHLIAILIALVMLVVLSSMIARQPPWPNTEPDSIDALKRLESFLGVWAPEKDPPETSPFFDYNSERYEWGAGEKTIVWTQGPHKSDRKKDAVTGYIFWHPVERKVKYNGFHSKSNFYFEGYYTEIRSDFYELRYNVYYPEGSIKATVKNPDTTMREYKDTHKLVDSNTMELITYVKTTEGWERFPNPKAKLPSVMRRIN